tara:strand:+ start:805 stop:1746 length:942 start_codon:yes stop_codon:yes gene_type:complete
MLNIKPSENLNIYGLNFYFNQIINLYDQKKMPNRILLSGKKGLGKSTLAYHIINCILSKDEDFEYSKDKFSINIKNKSYVLLNNQTHPNFHLIDLAEDKKNIDISQIRQMITFTNKSSFNNKPKLILLDNVEYLNKNSVNALLKVIEEPNQNIYFILIHNNEKKILPTLKSRCLMFKIHLSFEEIINITSTLINDNPLKLINQDLINYYNSPGEYVKLVNFADEKDIDLKKSTLKDVLNFLISGAHYKKNKYVKNLTINFIELFFLKEYKYSDNNNLLLNFYHVFIDKIHNTEKFNLDEESLFLEFKSKLLNE